MADDPRARLAGRAGPGGGPGRRLRLRAARGRAGQRAAHHVPPRAVGAHRLPGLRPRAARQHRLPGHAPRPAGTASPPPRRRSACSSPASPSSPAPSGASRPGARGGPGTRASPRPRCSSASTWATCCCAASSRIRRRGPATRRWWASWARSNIPIVHFSVKWWRALHQPSTILGPEPSPDRSRHRARALRQLGRLHPAVRLLPVAPDGDRPARGADLMPSNWGYVFAAYGLAAVALLAYWRHLARRTRAPRARAGPRSRGRMSRKAKFLAGGLVIVAALAYLVYAGVTQSVVYFVTPSELGAAPVAGKAYRLGGMVQPGTLKWEPKSLDLRFTLSDGQATVPCATRHAARSLRGVARRGRRGHVEPRRLLPGLDDPGQALGGVQGAARREPGGLQGAAQDTAEARAQAMTPELGYALTVAALVLALYGAGAAAMSARKGRPDLQLRRSARPSGVWLLITACMLAAGLRVPDLRLLDPLRGQQHQPRHALLLPHHRALGRARGLHHPLGVDALALHPDHGGPLPPHPARSSTRGRSR